MIDYTKHNFSNSKDSSLDIDQGLRIFMIQVYNYMAAALALTGILALFAANSEVLKQLLYQIQNDKIIGFSAIGLIVTLAPIGIVFGLSYKIETMRFETAKLLFWTYSGLIGLSLSSLFLIYTQESIAKVFFITSSIFGAMSLYGYSTKKDLTNFGSFLLIGLFGIIIAGIVNIILKSSAISFATSIIGVLIFIGLIAYDTQKIKSSYYQTNNNPDAVNKIALMSALSLYMDFVNLFIHLMRFLGNRKEE